MGGFMNRLRTFAVLATATTAAVLSITSIGVASAALQPPYETRPSEVYPGCEVFFDTPHVVDGKIRLTGGAKCDQSAPATVDWLVIWLEPNNDAPYYEWFGERTGSEKSHSASSTVPCVSGDYHGTIFASVFGDKGVEQIWVDRNATITC
ncbi:hypothetical protein DMB42_01240 [Nonomuraea sp. WAC 01424]|uniref:hypothetical protein n=1 Tax=Nonomuraea sp. WAC 01424 TaxID=2203200 RepID=UPI000F78C169|nr:hypothetical protein [Nonomuraea sp. WAC 01424]RSN15497.1 hypothetical protein DMB42_01240 [Nonomuraea sp. WAC 01424]